jgi:hypothetical protein
MKASRESMAWTLGLRASDGPAPARQALMAGHHSELGQDVWSTVGAVRTLH